jgi:hypothetical protein
VLETIAISCDEASDFCWEFYVGLLQAWITKQLYLNFLHFLRINWIFLFCFFVTFCWVKRRSYKARGYYWAKWICVDANEYINLHEYVGVSKIYDYSMNLLSFKEFDVEYLKNVLNCIKCMLSLMLNRYIFHFVLTYDNECGQIITDGCTECGRKTR